MFFSHAIIGLGKAAELIIDDNFETEQKIKELIAQLDAKTRNADGEIVEGETISATKLLYVWPGEPSFRKS